MLVHSLMTTMVVAVATTAGQPAAAAPTEAVLENCDIASIDSPELPASEAGMLINLHARDGQFVKKDMVLATIDDREAQAREASAQRALQSGDRQAHRGGTQSQAPTAAHAPLLVGPPRRRAREAEDR